MALFGGKKATPNQEVQPTPIVPPEPVPPDTAPIENYAAPPETYSAPPVTVTRPARSPLLPILGGLGALALAGVGFLAYSKMNATPTDEGTLAAVPLMPHRPRPAPPGGKPAPPPHKVNMAVAGQTTATGTPKTPAQVRTVPVAALGIAPSGSKGPIMAPATPGGIARMVPEHGAPTPIHPPPGRAAHPGKAGSPNTVAVVRPVHTTPAGAKSGTSAASPQDAQLKTLWRQGADAKHHNNYQEARRAWQAALKLAPGHPGFQDAINKLPR